MACGLMTQMRRARARHYSLISSEFSDSVFPPLAGNRIILPVLSISTRATFFPAISIASIPRFISVLRKVLGPLDIALILYRESNDLLETPLAGPTAARALCTASCWLHK